MTSILSAGRTPTGDLVVTACGNPGGHLPADCPGDIGPLTYGPAGRYEPQYDEDGAWVGDTLAEHEADADFRARVKGAILALAAEREAQLAPPVPVEL